MASAHAPPIESAVSWWPWLTRAEIEMTDPTAARPLSYSEVYAAAEELGFSEQQAMTYATMPDLFVADNPDWDFG